MSDAGRGDSEADVVRNLEAVTGMHTSAYVSIRQHTSACEAVTAILTCAPKLTYADVLPRLTYADICT
jgi:hypothetical protein